MAKIRINGDRLNYVPSGADYIPDMALNNLSNVSVGGATSNQVLQYNGSTWVPASLDEQTTLNGLSDVVITSVTTNQIIQYDGANWINTNLNAAVTEVDGGTY